MSTAIGALLLIWAAASALATRRAQRSDRPPVTVNGFRRRRAGESEAAWAAGVRDTYPAMYALPVLLAVWAPLVWLLPERMLGWAMLMLASLYFVQTALVLRRLDRAVARHSAAD